MTLVLTGSVAIDRIMVYPGRFADVIQPDNLHVLSVSVLLDAMKDTRGGIAANIAYTLSMLGVNPVLFASVGENAKSYMKDLARQGVDISKLHYSKLPTATFTVMTDQADCQVGGFYPGAMSDASSLSFEKFSGQDVFAVISAHDPKQMRKQVQECKKLSIPYFYDVGQQVSNLEGRDIMEGLDGAKLLIVNDYEMGIILEKTGYTQEHIFATIPTVVITLGGKGSWVVHGGEKRDVPSAKVSSIVDPTGAGDAFRAGYLYGMLLRNDTTTCAQLGSVAATYAIESLGAQEHHFTLDTFLQRYANNYSSLPQTA